MPTESINLKSKKARYASYDPDTKTLVLDFGRNAEPVKYYRYLNVEEEIWTEIKRRHNTHGTDFEESVGEYLGEKITGKFKDLEIPKAWEKLNAQGEVIERSTKPVKGAAMLWNAIAERDDQ
jgi:hypothetical protein